MAEPGSTAGAWATFSYGLGTPVPEAPLGPRALGRGWSLLWRRRWRWLGLTHVGLAATLVLYFLMVLFNSAGFSYSFWNEPPPTDAASVAAGLSLLVLAILVTVVGYFVYGAYCAMFLDAHHHELRSTGSVLGRALGSALRALWWGPLLFLAAIVSVVFVVPAIFVLPVLASLPISVIQRWKPLWTSQMAFVRDHFDDLLGCSAITATGGVVIWSSLLLSVFLADNFDGLAETLIIPVIWGCYLVIAFLAALLAAATAVLTELPPTLES